MVNFTSSFLREKSVRTIILEGSLNKYKKKNIDNIAGFIKVANTYAYFSSSYEPWDIDS